MDLPRKSEQSFPTNDPRIRESRGRVSGARALRTEKLMKFPVNGVPAYRVRETGMLGRCVFRIVSAMEIRGMLRIGPHRSGATRRDNQHGKPRRCERSRIAWSLPFRDASISAAVNMSVDERLVGEREISSALGAGLIGLVSLSYR